MFTDVFKYILDSRVCDIYSDITEYKAVLAEFKQCKQICRYYKKLLSNGMGCVCKNITFKNQSHYGMTDFATYRIFKPCNNVLNGAECVGENCAGFAANQKYITACEDYRIIKNKKKNFWMNKIQCNR